MNEPSLDAPVQVTDRVPFLRTGRELQIIVSQRVHLAERGESFRILEGHPFRALEIHEVTERPLPERHQRDLNIRRVPAGQDGEVRPLEMRRRADRRQDVRGQGQVQHLLLDDVDESGFPRLDPRQLLGGDALRDAPLQRKLGVEVFA